MVPELTLAGLHILLFNNTADIIIGDKLWSIV